MKSNTKKIFYKTSGYASSRNFLSLPIENYLFQKKYDLFKIADHIYYKFLGVNLFLRNSHWEFFPSKGVWHFFNGISFGKTPWVVTFETSLPRWGNAKSRVFEFGVKALASPSCKGLIAMSSCTKRYQSKYLDENFPKYKNQITSKITVVHPPQEILVDSYSDKSLSQDSIVFTIIGADFFRKGGKEVLNVFDKFLQKKAPLQLNIISTLQYGDYASQANETDLIAAKKVIAKYPESIQHYNQLSNSKVLEILKNTHIGLLPTYGDTYGYSVLEAQANGCPVISTNIRALPEINSDKCGWIIEVPKDSWGNGILSTQAERAEFSKIIEQNLERIIAGILDDPQQIQVKGQMCLKRIKRNHDPERVAKKITQIYNESFKD